MTTSISRRAALTGSFAAACTLPAAATLASDQGKSRMLALFLDDHAPIIGEVHNRTEPKGEAEVSHLSEISPEIWSRFMTWLNFRQYVNWVARDPSVGESEVDAMVDQLCAMEREMQSTPPASLADAMIKTLMDTAFGSFEVSASTLDEAVSLCGLAGDPRAHM